jgi:hypothetical protein
MSLTYPTFIPEPFANAADVGTRNVIPDTTVTPGLASWEKGFPGLTMQPIIAGGVPPEGQDFNGVLYAISSHTAWAQAGQPYLYSSDVSTAIGGYSKGTILGMSDGTGVWISQTNANVTDPDSGGSAGWVPLFSYGITTISTVGGTTTLTPAQSRRPIIVIGGALVSNATVILPTTLQEWLIVNTTTGAFTLTVKTASGTGIAIPQGGYTGPTGVYGEGTNIFASVSPVVLPTAVAPDPNTIALRDASGDLYALYFNQSSATENFTITSVIAQAGSDGWNRRMTLANFLSQIFNGAALTNSPTAPTQAVGDSSTKIATTAFANPGVVTNGNGTAMHLANGYTDQFGSVFAGNIPPSPTPLIINITFPVTFATALDNLQVCVRDPNGGPGGIFTPCIVSSSVSGAVVYINELNSGVQNVTLSWRAVGH